MSPPPLRVACDATSSAGVQAVWRSDVQPVAVGAVCDERSLAGCSSVTDVSDLLAVFDASTVHRLTTDKVIGRGEKYHRSGAVTITALTTTSVSAKIQGTRRYEVRLDVSANPDWSCTCPAAIDGDFCKHCVALALELAAIDAGYAEVPLVLPAVTQIGAASSSPSTSVGEQRQSERERLIEFLHTLPTDRLVDLVVEQADTDWKFLAKLQIEADQTRSAPVDLDAWIHRIDQAMAIDDYIDWRAADAWANNVSFIIDAMRDLIDNGHAGAVIPLAEYAFRSVEGAAEFVDDSNSGCLREISEQIGELHFRACELHRPDPVTLARNLIELELNSELEGLYHAVSIYADLLGDVGLAEYGRLLDSLGDGNTRSDRGYTVKSLRRAYLEELNDVDALVAELGKDPGPHDIVTIMTTLTDAGRLDDAIAAGRDGLARFRSERFGSSAIIDELSSLLNQRGDRPGAIQLYEDSVPRPPIIGIAEPAP